MVPHDFHGAIALFDAEMLRSVWVFPQARDSDLVCDCNPLGIQFQIFHILVNMGCVE